MRAAPPDRQPQDVGLLAERLQLSGHRSVHPLRHLGLPVPVVRDQGSGLGWARGHPDWCASQYYSPAAPNDGQPGNSVNVGDPSTWHWTDRWFQQNVGTPPAGKYSGDPQTWCNAPRRGIGARPTANTGVPLVDAYLWIKTVGHSDGQCNPRHPGRHHRPGVRHRRSRGRRVVAGAGQVPRPERRARTGVQHGRALTEASVTRLPLPAMPTEGNARTAFRYRSRLSGPHRNTPMDAGVVHADSQCRDPTLP